MTTFEAPQDRRREVAGTHPVIGGFHPDPSVCRVGEDYYLVNSSFEYSPGVPVWHSTDLVRWTQIGNALTGAGRFRAGQAGASRGIYAPTLRFHAGRFWLITTDVSSDGGQLLTSATDPAGPWEPAVVIDGLEGIDPDLAWDDDGTCYVTYCSTRPGMKGIAQARVDLEQAVALEEPRLVWLGTGLAFPEAPHLYRRDGWWYLMIAEGGTERGHGVCVARSRSPEGPFQPAPANPVFSHRSTTHPVQNTGHADLVEAPGGGWAAVYLGVRPRGTTPMFHVNGRETFLAGVDWVDGWPRFDEDRFAYEIPDRSFADTFAGPGLHPRWVSPGAPLQEFVTVTGPGLTLAPATCPSGNVSALMARVTDERWRLDVTLDTSGGAAGVLLRLDDRHWCELRAADGSAHAVLRIGPLESRVGEAVTGLGPAPTVRIASEPPTHGGPDDIALSVVRDGHAVTLARFDGRYLSTEVAGGFTGRTAGVRALSGTVHVGSVRYEADDAYADPRP
ncbi:MULTISPECIES: family 43 glycosylhydrolase [unclassified Nonomuraea]|uniref:glycoside hydrolase family 43 protein n=1 Tax=unclassified Nonomuraea TaxID=2593643 RepID=UPI0033D22AE5